MLIERKEDLTREKLERLNPLYVFLPHWSFIVPAEIYDQFECVIFHMTDLPYGRGGSPLQNLIVRGHRATKISALRCGAVLDGGPIYLKKPLSLAGTAGEILGRAAVIIEGMIALIAKRRPTPRAQKGRVVSFKRRTPADGNLAGISDPVQLYDLIRMLDGEGYPPAFVDLGKFRFELHSARLLKDAVEANVVVKRRKS